MLLVIGQETGIVVLAAFQIAVEKCSADVALPLGELDARRSSQATTWFWTEIKDRLMTQLRDDPARAARLVDLEKQVVDGTISTRTSVASSATASAIPTPIAFTNTTSASENAANTATMMAAALVMSRPLFSSPSATDFVLSPVCRYSS